MGTVWGVDPGPPHGGEHHRASPSPPDVTTTPDTSTTPNPPDHEHGSEQPARRSFRLRGLPAIAATSLAIAMVLVTILVQLQSVRTQDATEKMQLDKLGVPAPADSDVELGRPAPDVELQWLDGGTSPLSELRGGPVLVNFWSSTCAPCVTEMPAFEAIHDTLHDRLTVIGIDVADTESAGLGMIERTAVTYRNAHDPQGELLATFGGTVLPRTVLLDAEGVVLEERTGALDEHELATMLAEHGIAR